MGVCNGRPKSALNSGVLGKWDFPSSDASLPLSCRNPSHLLCYFLIDCLSHSITDTTTIIHTSSFSSLMYLPRSLSLSPSHSLTSFPLFFALSPGSLLSISFATSSLIVSLAPAHHSPRLLPLRCPVSSLPFPYISISTTRLYLPRSLSLSLPHLSLLLPLP